MLSKLLKHEFRATGRKMLPSLGVLALLGLLAMLSIRILDADIGSNLLRIIMILILVAFVIGITVIWIVALVQMILRFYNNLLKDEGYLMFTLPTNTHALIWSKLIVAVVWFFATALLIFILCTLAIVIGGNMNFDDIQAAFIGVGDVLEALRSVGIGTGSLVLIALELILASVCACLTTCLHFFAAMGLGQMSSTHKGLWSVLAFVAISIVFQVLVTAVLSRLVRSGSMDYVFAHFEQLAQTAPGIIRAIGTAIGSSILACLCESAVLYVITVLSLNRKLNLA